jgi:hypothetical protein
MEAAALRAEFMDRLPTFFSMYLNAPEPVPVDLRSAFNEFVTTQRRERRR